VYKKRTGSACGNVAEVGKTIGVGATVEVGTSVRAGAGVGEAEEVGEGTGGEVAEGEGIVFTVGLDEAMVVVEITAVPFGRV
jgi:hypothetical protein